LTLNVCTAYPQYPDHPPTLPSLIQRQSNTKKQLAGHVAVMGYACGSLLDMNCLGKERVLFLAIKGMLRSWIGM
jgi:hypothetical protein